jgi:putative phosphoesterase
MNDLKQAESSLIGAEEAILHLENADKGRLLVVADSHGEVEAFEAIILEFGKECDALIFCGDGASDLMDVFADSRKNNRLAEALPPVIALVRGNGDGEWHSDANAGRNWQTADITPVTFRIGIRRWLLFRAAGKNVFMAHGHTHGIDGGIEMLANAGAIMDADMLFFGHTHRPFMRKSDATLILNPGSISRPRGGFPPSFAIVSFPGISEQYEACFYEIKKAMFGNFAFSSLANFNPEF